MRHRLLSSVLLTGALVAAAVVGAGTATAAAPPAPVCGITNDLDHRPGDPHVYASGFASCDRPVELGVEVTLQDPAGKQISKSSRYCGSAWDCYAEAVAVHVPNTPYCVETLLAYRVAPGKPLIYLADTHCQSSVN